MWQREINNERDRRHVSSRLREQTFSYRSLALRVLSAQLSLSLSLSENRSAVRVRERPRYRLLDETNGSATNLDTRCGSVSVGERQF